MKVFEINHSAKPTGGRFRSFAGLALKEIDTHILGKIGKGRPFPGVWKEFEVYIPNPGLPRPEIFGFPGGFVMEKSIYEILAEPLEMCTEALAIAIEGEKAPFYLCHILTTMNAVDREKSDWMSVGGKKSPKMLTRPSFIPERLGEETLFKIPDDCYVGNYCLERTGDPEEGEFKAIVEQHHLKGLEFEEIWSF
jgi:hypothetical protein